MSLQTKAATASSVALRLSSYFFLRWGLLPPIAPVIFTLFVIYLPSFLSTLWNSLQDEQVVQGTEIRVKDVIINGSSDGAVDHEVDDGGDDIVVEELEITESIVARQPAVSSWYSLVTGMPNPRSLALSMLTLLVNVACVTMVADRVYSEHWITNDDLSFIRLGYVSDSEAKLLVREPDQSKMPVTVQVRLKDPLPPFDTTIWQTVGGIRWTSNATDYTAIVTVPAAHREQRTYEWQSSNGHSGEFTSAPGPGHYPSKFDGKFTFLSTSCIVNRLPYSPLDHPLSIPGMRHLSKRLPSLGAQFMLFLGDFIYVDVPKWWGTDVTDYRQKYRAVYASPEWPEVGQNLSWIHVLDDHEIKNDWDKNETGIYEAAVEPWHHYQTSVNPPAVKRLTPAGTKSGGVTWFEFTQGPASFFMLDTRSYRSNNKIPYTDTTKTMLGPDQLADLIAFLQRPEPKGVQWKIIASSVPFTKNWPVNKQDTWGGFMAERQKILEVMWDTAARGVGVVILSGDRHEFAATKFPPPADSAKWNETATVYEFSASPLSQFYSPISTYKQTDDEDVEIKYIHNGNSKFGAITIEKVPDTDKSTLSYQLFVDGLEAWNTTILSPERTSAIKNTGSFWEHLTGAF
ncbi:alkaline phosphatase family protein [Coniella lustricola]|uniref:Alkaline phosphatase family protein n=1 Tax=Coniella lustricola TaxID=2025994 RepID=A0A2T3AJM5_9PEZI|nr:alkaline phosphatase family protein [Coniella lustricola]